MVRLRRRFLPFRPIMFPCGTSSGLIAGVAALALACAFSAAAPEAQAQLFPYGRVAQPRAATLALAWQAIDFQASQDASLQGAPSFSGPAYGVLYARGNISASIAYGPKSADEEGDARLLDFSVETWNRLFSIGASETARLYVPLTLQSNYRRVAPPGEADSPFSSLQVTMLGLGAGLGGSVERGSKVRFEARGAPALGVAFRSFGGSAGVAWLVDASARVHVREVFGRMGVSAGYGFRTQFWRAGRPNRLLEPEQTRLDHHGSRHMLALGLSW